MQTGKAQGAERSPAEATPPDDSVLTGALELLATMKAAFGLMAVMAASLIISSRMAAGTLGMVLKHAFSSCSNLSEATALEQQQRGNNEVDTRHIL
jgi:hypothetical protein